MVNILNKKLNENKSFFSKNKKIGYNTPILTKLKSSTFSVFYYQAKYLKIPLLSKNHQILEDKFWFSDEKNLKWSTFLPFETPSLLFLPKIGIIFLHSSSFSIINSF